MIEVNEDYDGGDYIPKGDNNDYSKDHSNGDNTSISYFESSLSSKVIAKICQSSFKRWM